MRIKNKFEGGELEISSSKSYHHRYLLAAALSILTGEKKEVKISSVGICDDVIATIEVIKTMGVFVHLFEEAGITHILLDKKASENKDIIQTATKLPNVQQTSGNENLLTQKPLIQSESKTLPNVASCNRKLYNVGESGSTLRFIIPILVAMNKEAEITGRGSIFSRPLDDYIALFDKKEISYHYSGNLPLQIDANQSHKLEGEIDISMNTSSQFLSGLLFAAPLLQSRTKITLTSPIKSKNYIDLTLDVLQKSKIEYIQGDMGFIVFPKQSYATEDVRIEGDFSSACFFIAAGILKKAITIKGLNPKSLQGDRAVVDLLKSANADIHWQEDDLIIRPSQLIGMEIDAQHIIDSVPILCVIFATASGETRIKNVGRLRSKESNRIKSSCEMIERLGGKIAYLEEEDTILIQGVKKLKGAEINTYHDHRIAMSCCIAALICEQDVIIDDYLCINKSYTDFFKDFARLGGEYVI